RDADDAEEHSHCGKDICYEQRPSRSQYPKDPSDRQDRLVVGPHHQTLDVVPDAANRRRHANESDLLSQITNARQQQLNSPILARIVSNAFLEAQFAFTSVTSLLWARIRRKYAKCYRGFFLLCSAWFVVEPDLLKLGAAAGTYIRALCAPIQGHDLRVGTAV
ncbi:hypothetical protein MMC14_010424, partial [Varicellaria rhodocarpa]|nr:hypothetical protein [Varicellaria rhodocarpa]